LPSLEKLKQDLSDKPFEVVTIDVQEEREDVLNFMKTNGYSFTVLLDSEAVVSAKYNIRSHPMKFLIDPSGRIVGSATGYREWDSEVMRLFIKKVYEGEIVAGTR